METKKKALSSNKIECQKSEKKVKIGAGRIV